MPSDERRPRNAIAIEKDDPRRPGLFGSAVTDRRGPKALVLMPDPVQARDPCSCEPWLERFHECRSLRSAAVIGHDALKISAILRQQSFEHTAKRIWSVVGGHDDRCSGFRHTPSR